jgi:DNA-binding NarL/FixJ family response regulator
MTNNKTKIYFFEEHPLMVLGVGALIEGEEDFELCGSSSDPAALTDQIKATKPDAVVLDIALYTKPSFDLIRRIRKQFPDLPLTMLTIHREAEYAERALKAGANGYVLKTEDPRRLIDALRANLSGQKYLSERLEMKAKGSTPKTDTPIDTLSRREFEILQHIGKGFNNRQIAEALELPVKTVDEQMEAIQKKLGLTGPMELLQFSVHWVHHEGGFS